MKKSFATLASLAFLLATMGLVARASADPSLPQTYNQDEETNS